MPKYHTFIDMNQNEVRSLKLEGRTTNPAPPVEGQIYYNTAADEIRFYNADTLSWEAIYGDGVKGISANAPLSITSLGDGLFEIDLPAATPSQDGYMPQGDKEKLDDATSANVIDTLVLRDANGDFVARHVSIDTPTAANHATTKQYVDALLQGFNAPSNVRVTSEDPEAPTGVTTTTIDGVTLAPGDRILLAGQINPIDNGVYIYDTGAWPRAADWAAGEEVSGRLLITQEGTQYADTFWLCTNDEANDTVGTDPLTFSQFSGANDIQAGDGLSKAGNQLNVNVDDTTIEIVGNDLQVKDGGITADKIAGDVAGVALAQNGGTGALDVQVDGVTITVNGSNELEATGAGTVDAFEATIVASAVATPIIHGLGNRAVHVRCFDSITYEEIVPQINYLTDTTLEIVATPTVSMVVRILA